MTKAEESKALINAHMKGGIGAVRKLKEKWRKEAAKEREQIKKGKTPIHSISRGRHSTARKSSADTAVSRTKENIDRGRTAALNTLLVAIPGSTAFKVAGLGAKIFKTRAAAMAAARNAVTKGKISPKAVQNAKNAAKKVGDKLKFTKPATTKTSAKPKVKGPPAVSGKPTNKATPWGTKPKTPVKPKVAEPPVKPKSKETKPPFIRSKGDKAVVTPPPSRGMRVRTRKPESKPKEEVVNPDFIPNRGQGGPRKIVVRPRPKKKPNLPAVVNKPLATRPSPPAKKPTPSVTRATPSPRPPRQRPKNRRPNPLAAVPIAVTGPPKPTPPKKRAKDEVYDTDLVAHSKLSPDVDDDFFDTPAGVTKKTKKKKSKKDPHWREIKKGTNFLTKLLGQPTEYMVPVTNEYGEVHESTGMGVTSDAKGGLIGRPRKTTKVKIKKKAASKPKRKTSSTKKRKGFGGRGHGAALRGF